MLLYVVEATDKFLVCLLQRIVRIQLIQAGSINHREQEIAQFLFRVLFVVALQFNLQFCQLLTHLSPYILAILPVETHMARLVLNAVSLDERRQRSRHTSQHRLVATLLFLLNLLPVVEHLLHILHLGKFSLLLIFSVRQRTRILRTNLRGMIHMWMAEYQFINQMVANICYIKL